MWYVYILTCSDNTPYTGCTEDIERRIIEHNSGKVHYTSTRRPVRLKTYFAFDDKVKAFRFEKYLKSGSDIAFAMKHLL